MPFGRLSMSEEEAVNVKNRLDTVSDMIVPGIRKAMVDHNYVKVMRYSNMARGIFTRLGNWATRNVHFEPPKKMK